MKLSSKILVTMLDSIRFHVPNLQGCSVFFFESRSGAKDAPVVIWLTGGPGYSSELALFYENGTFKINDDLSLAWNDYGWDKGSNIIFVDQPIGTGFSCNADESDIPTDETGVSNDLYTSLAYHSRNTTGTLFLILCSSLPLAFLPMTISNNHSNDKHEQKIVQISSENENTSMEESASSKETMRFRLCSITKCGGSDLTVRFFSTSVFPSHWHKAELETSLQVQHD